VTGLDGAAVTETAVAGAGPNAIGAALGVLGDEWNLLIVQQLFLGRRRFCELEAALGIGPTVLSGRLSGLVDAGVLRREQRSYRLTESGLDLWALLLTIWSWEQDWVQGEALPAMRHRTCGHRFRPSLTCTACGAPTRRRDVELGLGPSGQLRRAVPVGRLRRRSRTGSSRHDGPGLFPETMAIMGSRWSAAVVGAAFLGAERFRDFDDHLGAPPNVLSERLAQLVALGVLDAGYRLTEKGEAFFPTACMLVAWGERWRPAPEGPALVATHRACGGAFVPTLRCSRCDEILHRPEIDVVVSDAETG
jgi:DNA-binding HxlR family transcriptional regulator